MSHTSHMAPGLVCLLTPLMVHIQQGTQLPDLDIQRHRRCSRVSQEGRYETNGDSHKKDWSSIDPLFRLPLCLALPKYWVCGLWVQLATRITNLAHAILCFVPKLNSEKNKGLWAAKMSWWLLIALSSLPPGLPFLHPALCMTDTVVLHNLQKQSNSQLCLQDCAPSLWALT